MQPRNIESYDSFNSLSIATQELFKKQLQSGRIYITDYKLTCIPNNHNESCADHFLMPAEIPYFKNLLIDIIKDYQENDLPIRTLVLKSISWGDDVFLTQLLQTLETYPHLTMFKIINCLTLFNDNEYQLKIGSYLKNLISNNKIKHLTLDTLLSKQIFDNLWDALSANTSLNTLNLGEIKNAGDGVYVNLANTISMTRIEVLTFCLNGLSDPIHVDTISKLLARSKHLTHLIVVPPRHELNIQEELNPALLIKFCVLKYINYPEISLARYLIACLGTHAPLWNMVESTYSMIKKFKLAKFDSNTTAELKMVTYDLFQILDIAKNKKFGVIPNLDQSVSVNVLSDFLYGTLEITHNKYRDVLLDEIQFANLISFVTDFINEYRGHFKKINLDINLTITHCSFFLLGK